MNKRLIFDKNHWFLRSSSVVLSLTLILMLTRPVLAVNPEETLQEAPQQTLQESPQEIPQEIPQETPQIVNQPTQEITSQTQQQQDSFVAHKLEKSSETPAIAEPYGWTPFQLAIWHPIQLFSDRRDVNGLRMSLFYGRNRIVRGLDFSLFSNSADEVYGVSILGIGNDFYHGIVPFYPGWNISQKRVPDIHGLQIGGGAIGFIGFLLPFPFGYYVLCFTKAKDVSGAQISVVGNYANKVKGLQISGFGNMAESDVSGFQLAGLLNSTAKDISGFQISTIVNIANKMRGLQTTGFFNGVGSDISGIQIGLINTSDRMKGIKIGVFNYSRRMTGVEIGLLNVISQGALPFMLGINCSMTF